MGLCTSSLATTSTSTVESMQGTHRFEITGYRGHKGLSVIPSGTFRVAGHKWRMNFCPNGYGEAALVSLELASNKFAEVRASWDVKVLHLTTGKATALPVQKNDPTLFKPGMAAAACVKRSDLEAYVHGDRLVFECAVTVFYAPRLSKTKPATPLALAK